MYSHLITRLLLHLTFFCSVYAAPPHSCHCKPLPGDIDWPNASAWKALNSSVSGRLVATVPPGAVCHKTWPQYDSTSCTHLSQQWMNGTFHYASPISTDYNDDTCPPTSNSSCSVAGYPAYAIQASCVGDVQKGVNFARTSGVRLTIKATGHDYPGRSSGAGSLAIHTSDMRGLQLDRNDSRAVHYGGIGSLKIAAGERFMNVNSFAAANNITVIGGADPGVGVGGWMTAGGHGPLTAHYGMGVDQVLEMEVVTPDGKAQTIDADRDPDLFWAMRGGGGSTFAVLTSVTVKVYPTVKIAEYFYAYNTTANSDTYWSMAAFFHSQIPQLSDAGLMGYYTANPNITGTNGSTHGTIYGMWLAPGKTAAEIKQAVAPMERTLFHNGPAGATDPIVGGGYSVGNVNFSVDRASKMPATVGVSGRLGSRLLDRAALTSDSQRLKDALRTSTPPPWVILGHVVARPGTAKPVGGIPGGGDSVLPAWREAYVHLVIPRSWPTQNATAKAEVCNDLRDTRTAVLSQLAPDTGAYRNEADPTEPEWQQTFYGEYYGRLLEIKKKVDPTGVFWCKACVGSELWDAHGESNNDDDLGVEAGVGQGLVRLCPRSARG